MTSANENRRGASNDSSPAPTDATLVLDAPLLALTQAASPGERLKRLAELLRVGLRHADAHGAEGGVSLLLARCEADASARAALARTLTSVFRETSALGLLAEGGLPNDRGLWEETSDRLARKLLPRPRDEHELEHALTHFLPKRRGLDALAQLSADELARLVERLEGAGLDTRPLADAASEALLLLAVRIPALGLTEAMRERADEPSVRLSAFHVLAVRTHAVLAARDADSGVVEALASWYVCAADVRRACDGVSAHLESRGVSLDLVYAIDAIGASLHRMEQLLAVLTAPSREVRARAVASLWHELVDAKRTDASLRALLAQNLRLLARKVIERAGKTGEHYITTTRGEYFAMLASAAGGGLLTTFTAAFKLLITALGGPLFVQGLLSGFNYAASFVAIQHLGCTLATKQPSMTAAALAGIMRRAGPDATQDLVTHVARIVRSQLAAALSNVLFVAIGAWLFHALWVWMRGTPFLAAEEADHVLESLHPWHSLTVFHAALTGVILWLSSLLGGSLENWAVYRRIPAAIAEHRLGARLGVDRMRRLARFIELHVSGWGGNVSLGFLLGMTPVLGKFFGLPLDVRHVTLSTGTLSLAVLDLGGEGWRDPRVWPAVIGIALIFVLNLGVSFGLALRVALRARDVEASSRRDFVRALLQRMTHAPLEFLFPPRDAR
ncbi:MAG: gliding motility protein [Planctomycetota bacterium]